jgi:hypothetical protein
LSKRISDAAVADIMPTLGNEKPSSVFTGTVTSYQTKTFYSSGDAPVYV